MTETLTTFPRTTLEIGWIEGYARSGTNVLEIEAELTETRFSVMAGVCNWLRTDYLHCGQMDDSIRQALAAGEITRYAPGWNRARLTHALDLWERWHLNDMQAACEHQRARGETYATHPSAECPDCGYRLDSAWLAEPIPADAREDLRRTFTG
jgi:hypothetical protein